MLVECAGLLNPAMRVAWIAAIGMDIFVAVKFLAGDREAVANARNWLLGLVLLASVLAIVNRLAGGGGGG